MNAPAVAEPVDVLIVGGGPVGACMAALLARSAERARESMRIVVLEPRRPTLPPPGAPLDLRVAAFSRASERIVAAAAAWDRIDPSRICAYERMRVWHGRVAARGRDVLLFDAADVAEPNLGYIIETRVVAAALSDAAEQAGVRVAAGELLSVAIGDQRVAVETTAGSFAARLVVGADGADSMTRRAIGLTAEFTDYGQAAIVAIVATERAHESSAWQRFLERGTLAFLPLADGTSSIVWSADRDQAQVLLGQSAAQFNVELERAADGALGACRLASERVSFGLRGLAAHRYVAHRCALIGDAAHVIHPLAGQGVNLGLLDAAALAQLLAEARAEGEDLGGMRALRRYERWRKSETEIMRTAVDAFDRWLAHGSGPLSRLAQRGLPWVNRSPEVRRMFIARALGLAGELPLAATPLWNGQHRSA